MNILFFYTETINPQKGGVERVTYSLANYFYEQGNCVYFLGLHKDHSLVDDRQLYLPNKEELMTPENKQFFRECLVSKEIKVVINQGAFLSESAEFTYLAKECNVKIISVIHNSLISTVVNLKDIYRTSIRQLHLGFLSPLLDLNISKVILLEMFKLKKKKHYTKLIDKSDMLVLLSESFKSELNFLTNRMNLNNVIAIPNPIQITEYTYNKEKEILYVGRINTAQKRVDVLIEIWNRICRDFPDWKLTIVGEGDELDTLVKQAKQLGTINIYFTGRQDPVPYYERASIFCLTSSFEGLPMTLIESLNYGVVPIIFNSFAAASDIIKDNWNGRLINPFSIDDYVSALIAMMTSPEEMISWRKHGINTAKKYDINSIGNQWISIFNKII
ncbi:MULTISPECIES: glycosyltransferase [Bacteroides]|uniref:Glycosyltransferase n=1 Tax=Bacteroides fragilis TaxID=817 RepID=A0A396C0R1_BACFG|nr:MULTISPECIES: glycosyltransferase [Bacteroides]EKA89725.1 hypothetical protein HMPREF1203_02652 [Bacteroides fragilis HMW 610]MBE7401298.1 glycosyltransferase [Bacteroides fragilis]MCE8568879.1 glycosyltransferase [Bacteroides fragilis]MDV6194838.1 glycosyltransferase [Bacteroides hominis (ex Liu et al. 2022)]QCQ51579.1 glycosyltransferase [Bacteroides fragilis]